jgi:hypothetical protein
MTSAFQNTAPSEVSFIPAIPAQRRSSASILASGYLDQDPKFIEDKGISVLLPPKGPTT